MGRWSAFTVLALIVFVPPAAAQAASPDPVRAIVQRIQAGYGVQISEVSLSIDEKQISLKTRRSGWVQFGPSGPVASEFTSQLVLDSHARKALGRETEAFRSLGAFDPSHIVVVENTAYVSGGVYDISLPEGKTWVRMPYPVKATAASAQRIDVFDPAVLRAVLKGSAGEPVSGGFLYRGAVSHAELYKASTPHTDAFATEPTSGSGRTKIFWNLWTDGRGLPTRLTTSETRGGRELSLTRKADTRYAGWGSRVTVTAPPSEQVIDDKDLPEGLPGARRIITAPR
ncbi:hypothetical protein [Streptosporangium sp. NPDC051022]|uniref:hypothetical protein n=1 Tax=Streptosporangium sp. NPDC051022 TaxID=3155752 RepID=UPI0034264CAE